MNGEDDRRGVDWETVGAKLRLMRSTLQALHSVGDVDEARLRAEPVTAAAVERLLSRLVDLAVDVNAHVTAAVLRVAPSTYRDSFALAARAGLLTEKLADRLSPSAGLRNAIVHEYVELDLDRVAASVPQALEGYDEYVGAAARWVAEQRQAQATEDD